MPGLRITGPEGGESLEVRPQVVVHTRYDPGLVIERHSHTADEVIYVSDDPVGFLKLLEERGIGVLPEPDPSVPAQCGGAGHG